VHRCALKPSRHTVGGRVARTAHSGQRKALDHLSLEVTPLNAGLLRYVAAGICRDKGIRSAERRHGRDKAHAATSIFAPNYTPFAYRDKPNAWGGNPAFRGVTLG
jgi:hypothetical protein